MKTWQHILLGTFLGIGLAAVGFLVFLPPRGASIELLPPPTPAPMLVQVNGAVQHPGVYPLPRDSRVMDAIQAAGGLSPSADQSALNLAARLKDGEKLVIVEAGLPPASSQETGTRSSQALAEENSPGASDGGLININTATVEELDSLPGIGETRAKDIIQYREANGGFKTIEELQNVSGIGPATFEKLKDLITID